MQHKTNTDDDNDDDNTNNNNNNNNNNNKIIPFTSIVSQKSYDLL